METKSMQVTLTLDSYVIGILLQHLGELAFNAERNNLHQQAQDYRDVAKDIREKLKECGEAMASNADEKQEIIEDLQRAQKPNDEDPAIMSAANAQVDKSVDELEKELTEAYTQTRIKDLEAVIIAVAGTLRGYGDAAEHAANRLMKGVNKDPLTIAWAYTVIDGGMLNPAGEQG